MKAMREMTVKIEKIGIGWNSVKKIREDILSILDGIDAKIQRYTDKAKTSEVFLTYDALNAVPVFRCLAKFFGRTLCAQEGEKGGPEFVYSTRRNQVQVDEDEAVSNELESPNVEICGVKSNSYGSDRPCNGGVHESSHSPDRVDDGGRELWCWEYLGGPNA
jgi:hypothetical protein